MMTTDDIVQGVAFASLVAGLIVAAFLFAEWLDMRNRRD